jgi:hypothetical protein
MSSEHAEARDDCREGRMTAALKPPSLLRTATGEPPLGRNAEFFTDDQGEILARQSTPPLILDQDWRARARRRQVARHAAGLSHQRPTLQLMRRDAALCDERDDQARGEVRRGGGWRGDAVDQRLCRCRDLLGANTDAGVSQFGQAGKVIALQ